MQVTDYFLTTRLRPDRAQIKPHWIIQVCQAPEHMKIQADGRMRLWRRIPEAQGRMLRVVLLADGVTVHNAFFDRRFKP